MNEFSTRMVERLWINAAQSHATAGPSKGNSILPKLEAGRGTKDESLIHLYVASFAEAL